MLLYIILSLFVQFEKHSFALVHGEFHALPPSMEFGWSLPFNYWLCGAALRAYLVWHLSHGSYSAGPDPCPPISAVWASLVVTVWGWVGFFSVCHSRQFCHLPQTVLGFLFTIY